MPDLMRPSGPDPYSLDYRGLLNLIGVRRHQDHPCDLHPDHIVTVDGCAYCRRIRAHYNAKLDAAADSFDDSVLVLAAVLLGRTGDKVEITWDEVLDARRRITENDVQLVTFPADRLHHPDVLTMELRYRARRSS